MRQIVTPNGYLAIERIGGIDVYSSGDCFVCELCKKTLADFSYNGKVNGDELDEAIEDELDTVDVMEKLDQMNQYC